MSSRPCGGSRARLAAERAGPIAGPLDPLTSAHLELPIEHEVVERGATSAAAAAELGADEPLPAIVGYSLVRKIRRGGQSVVYEAVHQATGRRVAVKVIIGGSFADAPARARFDREAAVIARLDHPNIVRIVDRGRTSDGSFYLAMDLIVGDTFDAWARGLDPAASPRSLDAVLRVVAKLAAALDAAHEAGVVHRDLKPSNVRVDAYGEPHVLDFGLAKLVAPAADEDITATGQFLGSLPWTSPEQAEGDPAGADARSDVYSLGVMLHHALTGRMHRPSRSRVRAIAAAVAQAVPRLEYWAGQRGSRPAVDRVVAKAVARRPADRYPSAAAFADDLERCRRRERVAVGRAARRTRLVVTAAAAACAGAAAFATYRLGTPSPTYRTPPPFLPADVNSIGMTMYRVPRGTFAMGSPPVEPYRLSDEPVRDVRLTKPYWVGRTEVTRAQYVAVVGSLPARAGAAPDDAPATGVTWDEAVAFCDRLSAAERKRYRLPTEAEWELACRAGSGAGFPAGDGGLFAWHAGNSGGRLHAAGERAGNPWGLFDVHGNAAEWCADYYDQYHDVEATDPTGPPAGTGRVVRGGSFLLKEGRCRAGSRAHERPATRRVDLGFRVVRDD